MSRWVFDIETDGLLLQCTRMWVLVAYNLDTKEIKVFLEGDLSWKKAFSDATLVVGHNILGFDIYALKKLFNFEFPEGCNMHDTLLLSQILDYRRFSNNGHSLEVWGEYLGIEKVAHNDWTQYSEAMLRRCKIDVKINVSVYNILIIELLTLAERAPQIKDYIRAEHAVAKWCTEASLHGWPFNVEAAVELLHQLEDEMDKAYKALVPRLGKKVVAVDLKKGVVETKFPRWTKQGFYDKHTANWFGIDPCSGFEGEERMVVGEYSRVEFKDLSLDSPADVKIFLFRNGWQPLEWNYKWEEWEDPNGNTRRKKIKTSPKITEESLEFLGGDGKLYVEFLTAKSRHGILKTWLENIDSEGNLHGDCFTIGTPSMRARHSIIVNVPAANSKWGKEMRSLFACKPGWKLVGCDSMGNQARGLAHYLGDKHYIDTLLHGDIHQFNADVLTAVLKSMGIEHEVPRPNSKRIFYAFLFGAAGPKLWSYIFGVPKEDEGRKLKKGFLRAVPGFDELLEKLNKIFSKTKTYTESGEGYIPSMAGNRIYVDSYHKLLVYLLQSLEKITCASAVMLTMERLKAENIPFIPLIFMHDEEDFMVPEEYAERAAEIGAQAFKDGPKIFGVEIMDGEAKIGDTWYDIH